MTLGNTVVMTIKLSAFACFRIFQTVSYQFSPCPNPPHLTTTQPQRAHSPAKGRGEPADGMVPDLFTLDGDDAGSLWAHEDSVIKAASSEPVVHRHAHGCIGTHIQILPY